MLAHQELLSLFNAQLELTTQRPDKPYAPHALLVFMH
jgi:hypothetical protein